MPNILSLLTQRKRLHKTTAVVYRPACFTKSVAYYSSECNAPASKRCASTWLVSVVGASEQKAVEILRIVGNMFGSSHVQLRWWHEFPPSYDCKSEGGGDKSLKNDSKSNANGSWVGYDPKSGCFDVPQKDSGAEITFLYYSDGCDPYALLRSIPGGDVLIFPTLRMLVPISDYVFDEKSCKTVVCCEFCPFLNINCGHSSYYAPLIVELLSQYRDALVQEGGKMRTLGEMNSCQSSYIRERNRRKVS